MLLGLGNVLAKFVPGLTDFSHKILRNGIVNQADRIKAQREVDNPPDPNAKVCAFGLANPLHLETDVKHWTICHVLACS